MNNETIPMQIQSPDDLPIYDVCPHCKRETPMFLESRDGKPVEVYRCTEHGDVIPMRSAIVNGDSKMDWSAIAHDSKMDWSAA